MQAQKKSLGNIQRKAVDLSRFKPVRESRLSDEQLLPLIIEPAAEQVDLAEWAGNNREYLEQKLQHHGGILFRGFSLATPAEFERVAAAIYRQIYAEYGDLPREGVAGKIYTSTPYPEEKSILYHNEGSHTSRFPSYISFFCMLAATQGGCSPIVDGRRVYQQLSPVVRERFERLGLLYVRNFSDGLDVSWQRFFQTEDRAVVEAAGLQQGFQCEWVSDHHLRIRQKCRGVVRHPRTGEMSFFNQVQLHHVHCLDPEVGQSLLSIFKSEDLPRHVYYGDGTSIEDAVMDHIGELYEINAVRFEWQPGDVVTLDNLITAHGRDPFRGPRKIVVALGDIINSAEVE
jgi:alpha-ketoglutarate-dependent taurine dioxygenase